MKAKTAIIIVAYKASEYLDLCLANLFKKTRDFHLYLVHNSQDQASYDVTAKYQKEFTNQLTVLKPNKNLGLVEGVAAVYESAIQHERICLLNPDTVVEKDWLDELNKVLDERSDVAMVGPDSNCYYPDSFLWKVIKALPLNFFWLYKLQLINARRSTLSPDFRFDTFFMGFGGGFCTLFRSEHVKERGYILDPKIAHGYWDDLELSLHLRQFGGIGTTNKSYVFHFTGASFKVLGSSKKDDRKKALAEWNGFYVFKKYQLSLEEYLKSQTPEGLRLLAHNVYARDFLVYLALAKTSNDFLKEVDSLPAFKYWEELKRG